MMNKATGFIQWKNTDVCMDFKCKCGLQGHLDCDFAYYIQCPKCNTIYKTPSDIEFTEATDEEITRTGIIRIPEGEVE